jgi:hypothetical protein
MQESIQHQRRFNRAREGLTGSWVLYTDTVALSGDDQAEVVYPNAECSTGTRNLYVDWQAQMRRG